MELVTKSLDEHDHLPDLFILLLGQPATILDQSSHPDDLHVLLLGECSGVMGPFEEIEPLLAVE